MKVRGVIFDMDGVLVDSEPLILEAARRALTEWGVAAAPEDFAPFVGMGEDRFIGGVAEKHGATFVPAMKTRTYAHYLELLPGRARALPGVTEVLALLTTRGIPYAVASSADAVKVDANLSAIGFDRARCGAVVTGDEAARKKPFPDLFLLAAARLGVPPAHCCVVEDAPAGLEAARAAGMRAVAVATTFPPDRLALADAVCASPAELTPALLGLE